MKNSDMVRTQELPIPETIADICRNDPLRLFTYVQVSRMSDEAFQAEHDVICNTEERR